MKRYSYDRAMGNLSRSERRRIRRRCRRRVFRHWQIWAAIGIGGVAFGLGGWLREELHPLVGHYLSFAPFVVCIVLVCLFAGAVGRKVEEPYIREELALAGYCPCCGYNLTGNVSGVCPECGEGI